MTILPIILMVYQLIAFIQSLSEVELENLLLQHMDNISYSSSVRPSGGAANKKELHGHDGVTIQVKVIIHEIGEVNENGNEFIVGVTIVEKWRDERLSIKDEFEFMPLTYFKSRIWLPDLYFYNTKSVLSKSKDNFLLWLYQNGVLVSSRTLRLGLYCKINLWRYPLDIQLCFMRLGSYGYPTQDLKLIWWHRINEVNKNVVFQDIFDKEFIHPQFKIDMNNTYYTATGTFSIVDINFKFQRNLFYHLIYTFVPATLIVCVSWMSFYIDYRSVPARIPFCLLTLLSLMTQWANINRNLPRLSYLKAIDVWMFICLTFIIASLFEYAYVNSLQVRTEKDKLPKQIQTVIKEEFVSFSKSLKIESPRISPIIKTKGHFFPIHSRKENIEEKSVEPEQEKNLPFFKPIEIDKISRYAFPFLFVLVNVIFWSMLTFND